MTNKEKNICYDCIHIDVCEWSAYETMCNSFIDKKTLERPQSKWIPVSERLPSDYDEDWVLVQIQEDNGYLWIPCVAEYRKSKDDWYSDANDLGWVKAHNGAFKVIAWQPLPERYKNSENDDDESEAKK